MGSSSRHSDDALASEGLDLLGQRLVLPVAVAQLASASTAPAPGGAVFTWGKGETGCLGHGEDLSNQLLPKKVEAWAPGQ